MVIISCRSDAFSETLELEASAVDIQSLMQKDKKRRISKFPHKPEEKKNMMLGEKKACCHVANAFLSRSELIWPISKLKISKMSTKCVLGEKLQVLRRAKATENEPLFIEERI